MSSELPAGLTVAAERRYATPRNPDRPTDGEFASELMELLGFELQDWQRQVLDVALELDEPGGRHVHRNVTVSTPRQQGKSVLMFAVVLLRALLFEKQVIWFGAQNRMAARSRLVDQWWPMLRSSPFADSLQLSRGAGFEALRARNGSILRLLSTEESSGHGDSIDLVVLDEVWSLEAHVEEAVRPATMSRRGSQIWAVSTMGTPRSTYWNGKVDAGRAAVEAGDFDAGCFFEWSAAGDADPGDPATWRACMPALGHTVDEAVVAADFKTMAEHEFRRAYLNQLVDGLGDGWRLVSREAWEAAAW